MQETQLKKPPENTQTQFTGGRRRRNGIGKEGNVVCGRSNNTTLRVCTQPLRVEDELQELFAMDLAVVAG